MQLVYFALETPVLEQRCSPAARNMSPSSEDVIPSYQHLNLPDQLRLTDWLWLDRLKESKFSCCLQQLPYAGAEHVGFLPSTKTVLIRFFFFFCQASHVSWFAVRNATPVDTYLARTCLFPARAGLQLSQLQGKKRCFPSTGEPQGTVSLHLAATGSVNLTQRCA